MLNFIQTKTEMILNTGISLIMTASSCCVASSSIPSSNKSTFPDCRQYRIGL